MKWALRYLALFLGVAALSAQQPSFKVDVRLVRLLVTVKNAAGRTVYVEFAPDPDIVIREEMAPASFTEKIAIEVKAGKDVSNIHNRIGEAEKSHQKARGRGFVECWTVVNVDRLNMAMARQESPSTNRFYRLSAILSGTGTEYTDFRNRIISLTGIKF